MTAKPSTTTPGRLRAIDALRGISAVLVLVHHGPGALPDSSFPPERIVGWVEAAGWVGVDLFFVLSGFLIAGLLFQDVERHGRIRLKRFWLRRGFKIWPSYFVAYGSVLLLQCLRAALAHDGTTVRRLLVNAIPNSIFVQNYVPCERWLHSWTIAVEEHFYTLLPLVITWLLARSGPGGISLRTMTRLFLVVAVGSLGLRIANVVAGVDPLVNYYQSHLRADSLLFGVFLAFVNRTVAVPPATLAVLRRLALPAVVAVLVFTNVFPRDGAMTSTVGFSILYLVAGLLVFLAARFPDAGSTWPRPARIAVDLLSRLGEYSYTVYLAHSIVPGIPGFQAIGKALAEAGEAIGGGAVTAVWISRAWFYLASLVVGVALSHFVERPALRWRSSVAP